VFENGVLKKIFGPKRDEVAEEWGRLHEENVYDYTHQILFGLWNQEE